MNRKIEDIKVNSIRRIVKTRKEDVVVPDIAVKDEENHNSIMKSDFILENDSSKYEFLKKKNNSEPSSVKRMSSDPSVPRERPLLSRTLLYIFIFSILVGSFYLLSTVFLRANVTVVAKDKTFELKHLKFTAGKTSQNVPFELVIVSDKEDRDIVLTNAKEVSIKAKGQITLYNEYSSTKAQKITAGSFVSDDKGVSYKTDTTVSIPAYTLDSSKKIIPGQVSVGITAFLPGEAYNSNKEFFTINSFKGTDKFKKIYGKATTPIEGGMVGLVYLMDDKEKSSLNFKTADFKEKLVRKLSAQVPVGYILYPDAMNFTYEIGDNISSKTPDTKVEMKGSLSAYILKESELSNSIIHKLLPDIGDKERREIQEPNISDLSFNFTNKDQVVGKDIENFDFELTGNLPMNWKPDVEALKGELVAKNKNNISEIFKQDPAIVSAGVKIIPFWSMKLPEDNKNINIILKKVDGQ